MEVAEMTRREKLRINIDRLNEINDFLMSEDNPLVTGLFEVIERYVFEL